MRRRGRPGREPAWVEVELVDADGPATTVDRGLPPPVPPSPGAPGGDVVTTASPVVVDPGYADAASTPIPRRPRRGVVVAVAAAALGLAAAYGVQGHQEAERRAALASVPGVMDRSLGTPVAEVWRVAGQWGPAEVAGTLVLFGWDAGVLRGVDPEDGRALWELESGDGADAAQCVPFDPALSDTFSWTAMRPTVVVCIAGHAFAGEEQDMAPTGPDVSTIDPATGETLQEIGIDGPVYHWDGFEGDLLLAHGDASGRVHVRRWDPVTGDEPWRFVSEDVFLPEDDRTGGWSVWRSGDLLLLEGRYELAVDLSTGLEVELAADAPERAGLGVAERVALPGGAEARWELTQDGMGRAMVVDPDGSVRFELDGRVLRAQVDDGSDPDVLVVQAGDGALGAVDAGDGTPLWSAETAVGEVLVRVDGRIVVNGGGVVQVYDTSDGTLLWEVDQATEMWSGPVTDGDVVLVAEGSGDATRLVAHRIQDGAVAWEIALPARSHAVMSSSREVLVMTEDALVVLR